MYVFHQSITRLIDVQRLINDSTIIIKIQIVSLQNCYILHYIV